MVSKRVAASAIAIGIAATGTVCSQDYPNKPIRIITIPAGGRGDLISRVLAQGIAGPLGQQVIVENRPSNILVETVVKAPPDGHTLLAAGSMVWIGPLLQGTNPEGVRGLAPITITDSSPLLFTTHPSLPVKSARELIALAKARPGELNYAMAGVGGSMQLGMELFKAMAGINIVAITYKGGSQALNDLVGGQVQMMMSNASAMLPYVKAGRLKALAVTSARPSQLYPGVPAVAQTGLPGYEMAGVGAIFAPVKTPAAVINRLNREMVRVLNLPEIKERLLSAGTESTSGTPEQLAALIKDEISKWGKLISSLGIKVE